MPFHFWGGIFYVHVYARVPQSQSPMSGLGGIEILRFCAVGTGEKIKH